MTFHTTAGRRIRALSTHLTAAAVEELPQVGSGPGGQGFGPRASQQPPKFDPADSEAAVEFFNAEGYCVVENVLTEAEIQQLHRWLDDRQGEGNEPYPDGILGPYSGNVLLRDDAEELDRFTRLPTLLPFVDTLWGEGNSRFAQFDFRWTEAKEGPGKMHFHHDATLPQRLTREPYGQPDWICSIIYLTDVDADSPSFAVVPKSVRYDPITQAKVELGDEYIEQPLYGKAGTAVWYDTVSSRIHMPSCKPLDRAPSDPTRPQATYHTRLDSLTGDKERRTLHQYWSRGGYLQNEGERPREPTPNLTNWVRIPKRLAAHPDPDVRLFFSHWNTGQCEWAARGFIGDGTLGGQVTEQKQ